MSGGGHAPRRLLPDAVLLDADTLLRGVVLLVEGGRVVGFAEEAAGAERFPGELWLPRPLALHAHLESFDAPSSAWPRASFAAWAESLVSWRAEPRLDARAAAAASLAELDASGCALVLAHVAEPAARSAAHETSAARPELLAFPECFEPDPACAGAWLERAGGEDGGLALHSPFGVSLELARAVFARGGPVSVHLGEHAEERAFLAEGAGPLAELFRRRGRPLPERRFASPVDWLEEAGGMRPGCLAVHTGDLRADELQRLADGGVDLVWCPGTHHYFGRPRPAFLEAGIPLPALGCDSRASNERLDVLREFRLACALLPEGAAPAWWRACTEEAARRIGRPGLGHLREGAEFAPLRLRTGAAAEGPPALLERLAADSALQPLGGLPGAP